MTFIELPISPNLKNSNGEIKIIPNPLARDYEFLRKTKILCNSFLKA